ncbi:hypothetical protein DWF00_21385 [Bosea caraganae]|uniref:Uncharacterized protein n=1 Tax=Bosea caraganae TaxID=2763117 RepID=A0A370L6C0_9HYPH|nr:hypothetical protein [Bosea caraganae]RDJ23199.1 hypothetical protein DWF00_21385 [Bosea caraganae]RDJ24687.1 hypothetical protein DWE98_13510 [Bosea caraganae]
MWPFPTRIIDDETVAWQLGVFEWFIRNLADGYSMGDSTLVVAGRGHFIADDERGHALAERIFDQIRRYIRVGPECRIDLVQQPPRRGSIVNERVALVHDKPEPLGTCRMLAPGAFEISYDADLLKDQENLVSTFVHELAHVLVPPGTELPVEAEEYEFVIDLCTAFLGFGVFLSNTSPERVTSGDWSWWRGGGYLPVNDRVMATALFVVLKDGIGDRATALTYLRPELRGTFKKALRQLGRFKGEIARLRQLDRESADAYEAEVSRTGQGKAEEREPAAAFSPISTSTAISIQMPPVGPRVTFETGAPRRQRSVSEVTEMDAGQSIEGARPLH